MRFDSLGQVDFAIGLVNSVLNLPSGQVNFLGGGGGWGQRKGLEKGEWEREWRRDRHFILSKEP